MEFRKRLEETDLRSLLRGIGAWLLSAGLLLPLFAFFVMKGEVASASLGYLSSALSFLCAAFAGFAAADGGGNRLLSGLLCALGLILLLLTIGALISDMGLDASAILSVASFTLAGCAIGAVLRPGRRKARSRRRRR